MERLIAKSIIKIGLAMVILILLSVIANAFFPTMTNEMAMVQFENDNFAYATWQLWQNTVQILNMFKGFTVGITGVSIAIDVYKFFKTRKENVNE